MSRSYRLAVAFATLAAVTAAGVAQAGSTANPWTRVSGPTEAGNQLGLARTADGVLHVIWNRGDNASSIFQTRFSLSGRAAGMSTVASGWQGNNGLALLVMPDGSLRLFAAGTAGIHTFVAPASGGSWTQDGTAWGGPVAESSYIIGATLTKDGQAVTAWRGTAAEGVPPGSIPQDVYEGGMTESFVATDASSGAIVLGGNTVAGQGGAYVQQILPSLGPKVVLATPVLNDYAEGLSGRIGAPGVYVAYADAKATRLYRYGGPSKTLATGAFRSATVCAAPEGRLWVAWGDPNDGVFVTRSNTAVSGFEPVQKVRAPGGGLLFVQCEGSAGPLDLFASAGLNAGFWHTHLLAQLALRVEATRKKATLSVRDAGDPVRGAAIAVGGRHLKTDAEGRAALALRPGSYTAAVTATGYGPSSVRFIVR